MLREAGRVQLTRALPLLAQWLPLWERRRIKRWRWDIGAREVNDARDALRHVESKSDWTVGGLAGASLSSRAVEPATVTVWVSMGAVERMVEAGDPIETRGGRGTVERARVAGVVARLESAGLHRSEIEYERRFTWIRGRSQDPAGPYLPPSSATAGSRSAKQSRVRDGSQSGSPDDIAFTDAPEQPRLHCTHAACLLALKRAAFGRTRAQGDTLVERDYHDVYLLLSGVIDELHVEFRRAENEVRVRALDAAAQLMAGKDATIAAARQMVRL